MAPVGCSAGSVNIASAYFTYAYSYARQNPSLKICLCNDTVHVDWLVEKTGKPEKTNHVVHRPFALIARERRKQETHYEEHRQWLDDQHRAGRLLFSGPTTDGAYGVYIMLASSVNEAETIAAQDPHHLRGIREMQVLEWRAHRAFQLNGPSIADLEQLAKKD